MKLTRVATAVACLAVGAAPAVANADKPANPGSQGKDNAVAHTTTTPSGQTKRCKKPTVSKAYVVTGTFTSWTGVKDDPTDAHSTYSGTLVLTVTRTNHHAKGAGSTLVFSHAKVRFDSPTATAPAPDDKVKVLGKIVVAKKSCSTQAASATPAPGTITAAKITFSTAT